MKAWRRKGGLGVVAVVAAAPIIVSAEEDYMEWSYAGSDPPFWQLESAASEFGVYTAFDTVPGADRTNAAADIDTDAWLRLVGTDGDVEQLTPYSNSFQVV